MIKKKDEKAEPAVEQSTGPYALNFFNQNYREVGEMKKGDYMIHVSIYHSIVKFFK